MTSANIGSSVQVESPVGRPRVLFVSDRYTTNALGGAERITQLEAEAWAVRGGEVAVFSTEGAGAAPAWAKPDPATGVVLYRRLPVAAAFDRATSSAAKVVTLGAGLVHDRAAARLLRETVAEFRPDVVHAHHVSRISYGAVLGLGVPTVLTYHDYHFECPKGGLVRQTGAICVDKPALCRLYTRGNAVALRRLDAVVAISKFIRGRLLALGLDNVVLLPNGLPSPAAAVRRTASTGPLRVLCVARLEPNKGVLDLARRFLAWDRPWQLTVIGEGTERAELKALAAGSSRLTCLGRLGGTEVTAQMAAADVVVVPSKWHEVQNTVVREAQHAGAVVIATRTGGTPDLVDDRVTGHLVDADLRGEPDWTALRGRLDEVDADPARGRVIADAGRRVAASYTLEEHVDALERLYADVLRGRKVA